MTAPVYDVGAGNNVPICARKGGGEEGDEGPVKKGVSSSASLSTSPQLGSWGTPQAGMQPLGLQAPHGGILQSLMMGGSGTTLAPGGAMGASHSGEVTIAGAQAPPPGAAFEQQQAFLFQLLAAQQFLAAQAGHLAGATMTQGPDVAPFAQFQSAPHGWIPQTASNYAAGTSAPQAPETLYGQGSQPSRLSSLTEGAGGRLELVFPRKSRRSKDTDETKVHKDPVIITLEVVKRLFHLPLTEAARQLGISPTAIKGACRRLGIQKWPFRKVTARGQRRAPKATMAATTTVELEAPESDGLKLLSAAIEMDQKKSSPAGQEWALAAE
eukprot:CAMPEP_0173435646 /NCGR_PEP_ID=MMETSP1357-20121228/15513_1 /TAXON_ID=77926 /ORGANISM="Hemiselmis rufescens, Strain PCC563" /LENGTH=325 /DNA_ID=CAMNT_0014400659 /DNA_START=47 /DNA_END=1024 /DNA_ORIENTATION=+